MFIDSLLRCIVMLNGVKHLVDKSSKFIAPYIEILPYGQNDIVSCSDASITIDSPRRNIVMLNGVKHLEEYSPIPH